MSVKDFLSKTAFDAIISSLEALKSSVESSESNASTSETNALTYKNDAETAATNAQTAQSTAETKASQASASASTATTAETNASNSANAAQVSENNAAGSEQKADQWANELEDVEVDPGKFSAYHWSQKAEQITNNNWGGISGTLSNQADLYAVLQQKSNEFTKPNRFDYKDPFFQQTGIIWDSTSNPSLSSGTIDTSPTGVQWGSVSSPTLTVI